MTNLPVKKLIFALSILIVLGALIFGSYSFLYAQKIYPNISIAGEKVGGLTVQEAQANLAYRIDSQKNQDIEMTYGEKIITLAPSELALEYQLVDSLNLAYGFGHQGIWWQKSFQRIQLLWQSINLPLTFQINQKALEKKITGLAEEINQPLKEASLQIKNEQVIITPSQIGQTVDEAKLKSEIIKVLGNLGERNIVLPIIISYPQLDSQDVQLAKSQLETILAKNIVFSSQEREFSVGKDRLFSWLELLAVPIGTNQGFELSIAFNEEKIKQYLQELAEAINRSSQDAKLSFIDDTIKVTSLSQNGYHLNQEEALKTIISSLDSVGQVAGLTSDPSSDNQPVSQSKTLLIDLPITILNPNIRENNIADLGLKELISIGNTSYKNSPNNRKHNIKAGGEIFNGVVIKPNEEFSFLKYLGDVSEERGFKKELVIKQDRTEPEVGGGLCQVSTTMFRAALNAGLKISERTNHKYRVSYYEPPVGLDATVYEPSPDLKFINDTPGYILIQTKVDEEKSQLTFEFYGTKDGRTVAISEPELYDWQSPPATRYIDDPEMNEGETKYLEKAHTGVKAKVTYVVTRDGSEINKQTFYSNYRAWGAVIKRGTKKVEQTTPTPEPTPTSEPASPPTPEQNTQPTT